jgi:predicted regulator of Ras-like GTPase activity (Roadblock/LC7/MglB family)
VTPPSAAARNVDWLLDRLADTTDGVIYAAAVSAEGLLLARSSALHPASADHLAAVVGGLVGLARGADRCFAGAGLEQITLEFGRGWLVVLGLGADTSLCLVADKDCDLGLVAWHARRAAERAAEILTPAVVAELARLVTV